MGIADLWLKREALSIDFGDACFVVVDTETSGLDVRHDRLLSIGACIVQGGCVCLDRTFYRELHQDVASGVDNILLHGIGAGAQLAGAPPADALRGFLEFAGNRAMVAFNAPFDHAFLAHDVRRYLGIRFAPTWIDAAELAKAMFPGEAQEEKTLDDWLRRLSILGHDRHNALSDAYATAQFFIVMLEKARREGYSTARGLLRAQRNYHWQRKR
ncbi:MAG: PolC-type DNA polymerase III [Betaproteobacteria bacterium]